MKGVRLDNFQRLSCRAGLVVCIPHLSRISFERYRSQIKRIL